MKLLDGNMGLNLHNFGFNDYFLELTPKAQIKKKKIDTLDFIKIKILCIKGHHQQSEKATHRRGKICKFYISSKEFISRICGEPLKFNNKNMNNPI